MYRVYLQDGKIVAKESYLHLQIENLEDIEFVENNIFVRPEVIEGIDLPAQPIWEEGKIVGAVSLPKTQPEPELQDPTTEEMLLVALQEITALKAEIEILKGGQD